LNQEIIEATKIEREENKENGEGNEVKDNIATTDESNEIKQDDLMEPS
jgi:hypothetical protein